MEALSRYFLDRPLQVNIIVLLVFIFGVLSMINIKKESFPSVSQNKVIITTVFPGASAKDIEINVTGIIEEGLEDVSNIKEVISTSQESMSRITVTADDSLNQEQFSKVYDDIGNALVTLTDLPADIEGPTYKQVTSDDMGIIEIALSGDMDVVRTFVPFVVKEIEKLPGISKVNEIGFPDKEYHILIDAEKARKNYVDLRQIADAIRSRNVEGSGGTLESYIGEKKVVAYNKFHSLDDVLETNIRRSFDGQGVRLKEVATIKQGEEDVRLRVRNDGQEGVSLIVKKKTNADLLNTLDGLNERLAQMHIPEKVELKLLNDQSMLTRDRISLLGGNALMGMVLVFVILYLVLGFKTAFWTSFSIPFAFMATFLTIPYFGITLNAVALGGFVLTLGMLVDDAIVVAEQINREKEEGYHDSEAGARAIKKIWLPVFGASVTTIIAYSPLAQMGGLPGKFVWAIPAIIATALVWSLFESYFLLPSHLCHGKPVPVKKKQFVVRFEGAYEKALRFCLQFRYVFILIFISLLASALFLAKNSIQKDPFPQDAAEAFTIQVSHSSGSSFEKTRDDMIEIEKLLLALPKSDLSGLSVRLGTHSPSSSTERGTESHLSMVFVYLKPFSERERTAQEIIDSLVVESKSLFKSRNMTGLFELVRFGPPVGKAFEVRVAVNDAEVRRKKVNEISEFIRALNGVNHVDDDELEGKGELNLMIDYDELSELGLTVQDVLTVIKISFDGLIVTDITEDNSTVDLRLRLNEKGRADIEFINQLGIMNQSGRLVEMGQFLTIEEQSSLPEIYHVDGLRTITIFGQIDKEIISPGEVMAAVADKFKSTAEIQISYAGEPIENEIIFGDLATAGIIALIGIFLTIVLILNSLTMPLIILAAIPFGAVGVIYSVYFHDISFSLFVGISLVGLFGIIVNDSLVMVFSIQEMMKTRDDNRELVVEGAIKRLRPVTLTSITTVAGLLPTAYAIGGYDPFISPMCLALGYGLLFGTLIVLLLVPILFYVRLDVLQLREKFGTKKLILNHQ
jgi:multidrug efflux pump subunit AcrB